jgi:FAD/FMN-containing dehydrogenase
VTGAALIDALAPHGLAFPVGHCAQVTTSGFLLSGGFGWNGGSWGPAAASVRGVDVVTSTGASLHASATRHPELFWAVRGAGLLCPVAVVRFHLDLHPLPRAIRTSTLTFQVEDAAAAAAWLETARAQCPPEVELVARVTAPPSEARAKGAPARVFVASATAFADTESDAARWLAPFERGPERPAPFARAPLVETPFRALFASIAAAFPEHACYAVDHLWSQGPAADVLAATQALAAAPASPGDLLLVGFGPAPTADAPPLPDMALAVPGHLYVAVYGVAADPARAEASRAWMRSVVVALAPYRAGRYVGEASAERASSCFSPEAQNRLAEVTRQYDPRGTLGGPADA